VDINLLISKSFKPLITNESPYLILIGGAGSGKSEFAARKLFYRCITEGGHRFLILRKVRKRIRESTLEVFRRLFADTGVLYDENKSDLVVKFAIPGRQPNELLFDGLDDPLKIKSIVGLTGIWMEEATEFTPEDFTQLDLRLRGVTPFYKQIILTLNPDEAVGAWIKEMFCWDDEPKTGPGKRDGSFVHHSTVEDNPIASERAEYAAKLESYAGDKTTYAIYRWGRWALAQGIIYNWDVVDKPEGQFWDEIFYGLDFGYSVDPAALIRIYRKADEFWLEEVIYEKGLTNPALAARMKAAGIGGLDQIYADSAEPKSIAELLEKDFSVYPCGKGADSVRSGIDYLRARTIHILKDSENIIRERKRYKYKDAPIEGLLPVPVDFENHAMDAIRYGIVTHMGQAGSSWNVTVF
jgi:phage terminase large subunit